MTTELFEKAVKSFGEMYKKQFFAEENVVVFNKKKYVENVKNVLTTSAKQSKMKKNQIIVQLYVHLFFKQKKNQTIIEGGIF